MAGYTSYGDPDYRHELAGRYLRAADVNIRDLPLGRPPEWETELGHSMDVQLHPKTGEWTVGATHYGDPTGTVVRSMLGTHDESEVPQRLSEELRHRETLGHMQDQYHRAYLNNDPTGKDEEAQRSPRYMATHPQTIVLDHYGLHS